MRKCKLNCHGFFQAASRYSELRDSFGTISLESTRVFRPLDLPHLWGKYVWLTLAAIFEHKPPKWLHFPVMPAFQVQWPLKTFLSYWQLQWKIIIKMLLNHKSLYVVENIRDIHSRKSCFYLNKSFITTLYNLYNFILIKNHKWF